MEKPTKRTVGIMRGHSLKTTPMEFYHPAEVDAYIAHLERRAEAAEAEIAAIRGAAVPVYQYESGIYNEENGDTDWYWDDCDKGFYDQYEPSRRRILFTRPAPAADLADLVPDAKAIRKEAGGYAPVYSLQEQQLFIDGATWLRDAILRNIEEAK